MKKEQFSVRIETNLIERIESEAKKRDRTRNYVVREALLKAFPSKKV